MKEGAGCALLIGILSVICIMGPMGIVGLIGGGLAIGFLCMLDLIAKGDPAGCGGVVAIVIVVAIFWNQIAGVWHQMFGW